MASILRNLPTVSELLESPPLKPLVDRFSQSVVVAKAGQFLDNLRSQVQSAASNVRVPAVGELAERIADWIQSHEKSSLTSVVNATGIILHNDLGRLPLADEALAAAGEICRGYANVDFDLASGGRSARCASVERLLIRLTGAEAALIVNNNASALLLVLSALAQSREVIISRGQLLEYDDGLRIPGIVAASGAVLRDVGTTNQTRLADYAAALSPATAAILRIHASNYEIAGAASQVSLRDLASLDRPGGIPLIEDLGSGALVDLNRYGLPGQPVVSESLRAGADLVLLCGDKLVGGPQCGIIVGRQALIDQLQKHPLRRALGVSKLTLAALAATLRLYESTDLAERSIPLLSLLGTPLENLRHRAARLAPQIAATGVATVEIRDGHTYLRGIPLAHESLPTVSLSLTPASGTADNLAAALREGTPAVVGRVQDGQLCLDLRSVQPRDDVKLVLALEAQRRAPVATAEGEPQMTPA